MSKRILIIGQESKRKQLLLERIKIEGYEFFSETEAEKAINYLYYYREFIDLIIFTTKSNTYSALNMCRKIRKLTEVPVIVVTARDEEYDEQYGENMKNVEFVSAHISPDILFALINALLKPDSSLKP